MLEASNRQIVILFLKFPEPGKVKTRLARDLGPEKATQAYIQMLGHVGRGLLAQETADVAYSMDPIERLEEMERWLAERSLLRPGKTQLWGQSPGDLGERQEEAVQKAFKLGYESVALVGTDCLALSEVHLERCWDALETAHDLVFGPTFDGGYYLLGAKASVAPVFRGVEWSSSQTFSQCYRNALAHNFQVKELEKLNDIDEIQDWNKQRHLISSDDRSTTGF